MKTIEEIYSDINKMKTYIQYEIFKGNPISVGESNKFERLYDELRKIITDGIPFDRLEQICNAEREGRLVVLPCGVDLMKIYNELTSVCEGDGVENYTNGYRWGHKNGQIELIRKILNISEGVNHEPEQALKGGASK